MKVAYGLAGLRVQIFSVGGEIAVDFTVWCVHILVDGCPNRREADRLPVCTNIYRGCPCTLWHRAIAVEIARHDRDNRNVASRS